MNKPRSNGKEFNCCPAIEESIGSFFARCGLIMDGITLNGVIPDTELVARTQIFEVFVLAVNARTRAAFADLARCSKCKNPACCASAALAIADTGVGYINFGYQAVLSLGNPIVSPGAPFNSLQEVINLILADVGESYTLILSQVCKAKACGCGCGNN